MQPSNISQLQKHPSQIKDKFKKTIMKPSKNSLRFCKSEPLTQTLNEYNPITEIPLSETKIHPREPRTNTPRITYASILTDRQRIKIYGAYKRGEGTRRRGGGLSLPGEDRWWVSKGRWRRRRRWSRRAEPRLCRRPCEWNPIEAGCLRSLYLGTRFLPLCHPWRSISRIRSSSLSPSLSAWVRRCM